MIIILKRDDLPKEHRHRIIEEMELEHSGLSAAWVERAELIVFIEGLAVKFLKQLPEIQSQESLTVLVDYITSTGPVTKELPPWSVKGFRPPRKSGK